MDNLDKTMRVRCAYSPWHYYNSKLRTIIEEGENDHDALSEISSEFQQQNKTTSTRGRNSNREKPHKDSNERQSKNAQEGAKNGLRNRSLNSIKAEPHDLALTDIWTQSSTCKSMSDEEQSRDMASRLFPEFFAEQLDHKSLAVTVKSDADPLVDCWLGFYGRIG